MLLERSVLLGREGRTALGQKTRVRRKAQWQGFGTESVSGSRMSGGRALLLRTHRVRVLASYLRTVDLCKHANSLASPFLLCKKKERRLILATKGIWVKSMNPHARCGERWACGHWPAMDTLHSWAREADPVAATGLLTRGLL